MCLSPDKNDNMEFYLMFKTTEKVEFKVAQVKKTYEFCKLAWVTFVNT